MVYLALSFVGFLSRWRVNDAKGNTEMRLRHSKLIALAALTVLIAGCNGEDASNLTKDVNKIAHDAGKAAGDAELATRVNSVLVQRKGISMSGLHIEPKHGVVTVSGYVRDAHEKHLVLDTIQNTRGVDQVIDKLRIQHGSTSE
jgi:osmotically-inducible protein OsmY